MDSINRQIIEHAKGKGDAVYIPWRSILFRLPMLLLLPLGILLPRIFGGQTAAMERYAQEVYPIFRDALSSVTSLIPLSLAELLIYFLCILIPLLILREIFFVIKRQHGVSSLVSLLLSVLIAVGVGWNLFYVTWGFNYFRAPLASRMELPVQARSVDELESLTLKLAAAAGELRETLSEDETGVFTAGEGGAEHLFAELPQAYAALSQVEPVLSGKVTPAKPVEWSEGLSWLGISGIYIGLTAEPNVNVHQPDLLQLHAAAHEMAHQLGIASEDAAEFVGFLACQNSTIPEIRYSGLMNALVHCGNALHRADSERYYAVARQYSDALWRDFSAYNAYWDAYEGTAEEIATQANDNYLKHNAQPSGVRSYGESVDLLLAYRAKQIEKQKMF